MPAKIDLTGQKFNRLTVIKESENKRGGRVTWICQCECGNIVEVTSKSLRDGTTQSCGCLKRKNILGQKFGKLTVIEYTNENRHGSALWKCKCDCGNICYATTEGLRIGDNVSCGCRNLGSEKFKERYKVDLTNKKFGKLLVLHSTDLRTNSGNQIWKCQCECGNVCYISTNHLQTGNTQSCGCLRSHSIGEINIQKILQHNNIKYKNEYIFPELPNRRYDFAILNENNEVIKLIEFDGEQHFIETPFFKTTLVEQQKIDNEKNNFAKIKNIPLIRIPYWKRDNITLQDLEVDINELSQ